MNPAITLEDFAARLREQMLCSVGPGKGSPSSRTRVGTMNPEAPLPNPLPARPSRGEGGAGRLRLGLRLRLRDGDELRAGSWKVSPSARTRDDQFNCLALELFALQFEHNASYRKLCEHQGVAAGTIRHWDKVPAVPAFAFKELELSCIPVSDRTAVFHSSGTTEHRPSRHFHNTISLALYEATLLPWFKAHLMGDHCPLRIVSLTPPRAQAPHSSLVHMFETVNRAGGFGGCAFTGRAAGDGSWVADGPATVDLLREAVRAGQPVMLLGTAFLFVHFLDHMAREKLWLRLPTGSRVLETGGYKGRSRTLPKFELHSLMTAFLGVPAARIVCEYGMSELSSQAYDRVAEPSGPLDDEDAVPHMPTAVERRFQFPPWARVQIISPETGAGVEEGGTGLLRVFDLANVYSVMAVQTEDLAINRGDGFELLGRAACAEARGCSLLAPAI